MAVIRTWACCNCGREFDSWEPYPECPACECVRVTWVPGGGHIAGISRSGDAEFRALADVFKLDDLRSARRDEAAKITRTSPTGGTPHNFGGGFIATIDPSQGAQCVPTANKVNFKVGAEVGRALGSGQLGLPSVQSRTAIEGTHRGKP